MREWINQYTEAYPLIANILIFAVIIVCLLMIRKFALNRLYKQFNESENWYVTRKVAKWLTNGILVIAFVYIFGTDLSGFTTAMLWISVFCGRL